MENHTSDNNNHFDIHASIIFQLGESLISDPIQAIAELIKNAYDADSRFVTVEIQTSKKNVIENSIYPDAEGYILITDGGIGMDWETIKRGWLTISNSIKREMKSKGEKTPGDRMPLGDKGLGRFGAQRLGHNLEIFTKKENEPYEYHVAFSWKDFYDKKQLKDVPIFIDKIPSTKKKGTTLLISSLKEDIIFQKEGRERLNIGLSKMISPYFNMDYFIITVKLNGENLSLALFEKKVLDASEIRYTLDFDGKDFVIKGKARLRFISPQKKVEKALFSQLVEEDRGAKFFEFLSQQNKAREINLKLSKEDGWFVEYETLIKFENLDEVELVNINGQKERANPGSFDGRVDSFDITKDGFSMQNIFNKLSDYKEYIKSLSGIKVYRDNFGIRVDNDWLGFGKAWTSGRSYYGLKIENTIGYIALSSKNNQKLEETTDREGFKISPYYNNFFKLLSKFTKFSGDVQSFLRRGLIEYFYGTQRKIANIDQETTPADLSEKIRDSLAKAYSYDVKVNALKIILNEKIPVEQKKISDAADCLPEGTTIIENLKSSVGELKAHIDEAVGFVNTIDEYLTEIKALEEKQKVLINQIQTFRDQIDQLYEMAGLGLTAEALSHEIENILDVLKKKAEKIIAYYKAQSRKDPAIGSFLEYVSTVISTFRKQMSHLSPSMRYIRERREKIELFPFCREIAFFYFDRLKSKNIEVQITPKNAENFFIKMNPGKLTQIFDNLFLNSEYWLKENIRIGVIKSGKINIIIDKPFIKFSDNGKGVDISVENTLFEPFVTTKGKGEGRGLGLFIIQQFLESEGCDITLMPKRNEFERLYVFEINFSGGMDGSQ